MKIHKNAKIELVASKDASRFVLTNPYLQGEQIISTDGRRLIVMPVIREEGDTDGYVTKESLVAARKAVRGNGAAVISAGTTLAIPGGPTFPRPENQNYPNWQQVVPKAEQPIAIGLNAKMLYEMAQAMGSEQIRLEIKDTISPIVVLPLDDNSETRAKGVLMPYKVSLSEAQETYSKVCGLSPVLLAALKDVLSVVDARMRNAELDNALAILGRARDIIEEIEPTTAESVV